MGTLMAMFFAPTFTCSDVGFRHVYSEDQETVLGHPDTAKYY